MTSGDLIEFCRGLADLGFQQAIFNLPNVHEIRPIEVIGREVLPEVSPP
jgi:hypothetical protein